MLSAERMFTSWRFTAYALPSLTAAAVCLAMAPPVWRRRHTPGASAFVVLLLAVGGWSLCQAASVLVADLASKILLAKIQYIGIVATPLAWFVFAVAYTGRSSWLSRPWVGLLAAIPVATLGLVFTNERHGLIWSSVTLSAEGPFPALAVRYGPWFPLAAAQAYLLVLASTVLTAWTVSQSPHHRRQVVAVGLAPLVVCVANLLHVFKLSPVPLLDLTPLSFAVAGAILAWSLLRHHLLVVSPVARNAILDGIADGVLVLDTQKRVVDLNRAAQGILALTPATTMGRPLDSLGFSTLLPDPAISAVGPQEVVLQTKDGSRVFEISSSPLHPGDPSQGSTILVLRDTTARKVAEDALRRAKEDLQRVNEQLARLANTDALTGLNNRRFLLERLAEETSRARRYQLDLSVLLLDLDYFKRVNDTHGHLVGDRVLAATAGEIETLRREYDVAGRLGGEEFALILPETDPPGARILAERVRAGIAALRHQSEGRAYFRITASVGIASFAQDVRDGTQLLSLADAALYRAKRLGRDRVCSADLDEGAEA
ncbi:MAG: histidine kinase N-terminal 7TM domain-containing protein [Vicinamibacteria bacterium]